MTCDERTQCLATAKQQLARRQRLPIVNAVRAPSLETVQSGSRQQQRLKQLIEHSDTAAADECDGTTCACNESAQENQQLRLDHDALGRRRDLEQRAVDVEKQRQLFDVQARVRFHATLR